MNQSKYLIGIFLLILCAVPSGCTRKFQAQSSDQAQQVTGAEVTAISETLKKIIANQLDIDPKDIQVNIPLSKLKKPADDLDVVEIILTIEEKYKIELKGEEVGETPEKAGNEMTVEKLEKLVAQKKKVVR